MKKMFDYLEDADEVVYTCDADTYELLYLNKKGYEILGYPNEKSFRGKKCYEVIYNRTSPCQNCIGTKIDDGKFMRCRCFNREGEEETYFLVYTGITGETGRRYRTSTTIDISKDEYDKILSLQEQKELEQKIIEAAAEAVQKGTPQETVNCLLENIGKILQSDRSYIYQTAEDGRISETFEWIADGLNSQQPQLQNLSPEIWEYLHNLFLSGHEIKVSDMTEIKNIEPTFYNLLREQDIRAITVIPLYIDRQYIGFLGVNNPSIQVLQHSRNILTLMGHYISAALNRYDLACQMDKFVQELRRISYTDELTGLENRHALDAYMSQLQLHKNIAVLFSDITGLKHVNDTQGHVAGDALIVRAKDCVKKIFSDCRIYRFGGDEILVIAHDISQDLLMKRIQKLRDLTVENDVILAIGYTYAQNYLDLKVLINRAEAAMYRDKEEFYRKSGIERRLI